MAFSSISAGLLLVLLLCLTTTQSTALSGRTSNSTTAWGLSGIDVSSGEMNSSAHASIDLLPTLSSSSIAGGLGAFIAAGMGMTDSTDTTTPGETTTMTVSTATARSNKSIAETHMTTRSTALTSNLANASDPYSAYRNLSYTGECLDQWNSYWASSSSQGILMESTLLYSTNVATILYTKYTWDWSSPDWTTWIRTETIRNGAFVQATSTFAYREPVPRSWAVSTYSIPSTSLTWSTSFFDIPTIPTPTCALPDYVPACQSSWEAWISFDKAPLTPVSCIQPTDVTASSCVSPLSEYSSLRSLHLAIPAPPKCTQAAITGSYCSERVRNYVHMIIKWSGQYDGETSVGGSKPVTSEMRNETITTYMSRWPASSSLIPGCTVGCQACQIKGATVQLIYWPPASSTWIDGMYSAASDNSTTTATVVTLGTTLTSPTVYVSFDPLYAHDMCSVFSNKTYSNQIVAITDTATLSSIWDWSHVDGLGKPASFNFTDLYVSPVPDAIYESQPRCASSLFYAARGGAPRPSGWACARDYPYEPILAIPDEVRQLDPSWASCNGSLNGVYDPPSEYNLTCKIWCQN
jgi:hypothetical protein